MEGHRFESALVCLIRLNRQRVAQGASFGGGKNRDLRSKTNAMVVLAHCKPLGGWMTASGEKKMEKDFYSECESLIVRVFRVFRVFRG